MSDLIMRACTAAGVAGVIVALAGLIAGPALVVIGIGLIVAGYCAAARIDSR